MASTSSSSRRPVLGASHEGLKHLYRTLLQQARLLSATFSDPILYTSHRFLARKNIEPLLTAPLTSEAGWPPSTASKRLARARLHRRQLADANHGWEHAVDRALSLAYARSGKLRRDALADISPKAAPSTQSVGGKGSGVQASPVLLAIVTNPTTMNGVAVKKAQHMTGRPPPPFLPAEDDPLVAVFGRAKSARRVHNAMARYRRTYLRKVKVPIDVATATNEASIFGHLENLARPRQSTRTVVHRPYLRAAREAVEVYRSDVSGSAHRKRTLRVQGWSSHPKHYTPRAQRRLYGRILNDSPLLLLPSKTDLDVGKVKNDPLGIRARLRAAHNVASKEGVAPGKIGALTSKFAVGAAGRGRSESLDQSQLAPSEVHFLKQNGLL